MPFLPPANDPWPGLVRPVGVDPEGSVGPTRKQARGPGWRRTSRGLFVPAGTDGSDLRQRIVEAAAVLPAYGGVTGWAALAWCGGRWFDGLELDGMTPRPVTLVTSCQDIRSQDGIVVSAERLDPREIIVVHGLRVTIPARSVAFEARYAPSLVAAVECVDMAAFSDLASLDECAAYAAKLNGWTGVPRFREAIPLGDENSWSPQETFMRRVWTVDAGRARPLCNQPVFDAHGRHVGTPDLIDPVAGVAGEYDSNLHLQGAQRSRDVRREGLFRGLGLEYVAMLTGDRADPADFIRRLHEAYARAQWVPAAQRRWRMQPPPWWTDTSTVASRRALSEGQRLRLLKNRAA